MNDKPYVLIVEDDPDLSSILAWQFRRAGFAPICLDDGQAALDWLSHHTPRLILLDVMLPGRNGYEVCDAIRSHARHELRALPIIMLTALPDDASKRRGYHAGAGMVFRKPLSATRLLQHAFALLAGDARPISLPA